MFDPSGPLPPSVYWRRRAGAVVATIVAVVLLAWIIGGLIGDDGPGDTAMPNMAGMLPTRPSAPPSSPPPMTRYTKTAGSTTKPPPKTTKSKPQPPLTCSDAAITVSADLGAKRYQVGQRPVLKIVVGNRGQLPCTRDISRKLRELIVVSGDGVKRLWSSNDCADFGSDKDVRLLKPGQKVSFSITWAGRTSARGCPAQRTTVGAGKYYVVAKLGKLAGHPVPLQLTG